MNFTWNLHDEVDALVETCLIYEDRLLKMIIEYTNLGIHRIFCYYQYIKHWKITVIKKFQTTILEESFLNCSWTTWYLSYDEFSCQKP
jgi:hypothetical protein